VIGEEHRGLWFGDRRETDRLENPGIYGRIILKWIFKQWDGETETRLLVLRIGTCGECLGKR